MFMQIHDPMRKQTTWTIQLSDNQVLDMSMPALLKFNLALWLIESVMKGAA